MNKCKKRIKNEFRLSPLINSAETVNCFFKIVFCDIHTQLKKG